MTATLITASHTDKYSIATIKAYPIMVKIFPGPNKDTQGTKFLRTEKCTNILKLMNLHLKERNENVMPP